MTENINRIEFVIRCATIGDADFMDYAHLFLIPDEGFSKIGNLHEVFYRELLVKVLVEPSFFIYLKKQDQNN